VSQDVSRYEELQGRLRGLLIAVACQLPGLTVQLVGEMIDANECGVALETISEMLVESNARIAPEVLASVGELVDEMDLPVDNLERLRPYVAAP
jgi:hypothetical protein